MVEGAGAQRDLGRGADVVAHARGDRDRGRSRPERDHASRRAHI